MADAITSVSDFKIHSPFVHTGLTEVDMQNVAVFNEASRGAIQLRTRPLVGHYDYQTFYTDFITVERRITTDTSTEVDSEKITDDQFISVKINRRTKPVQYTADAFTKKGQTPETASLIMGRQLGVARQKDMLNAGLSATVAALETVGSTVHYDATDGDLALTDLTQGLQLFGDHFGTLAVAVMHSKTFFDLVRDGLANYKVENVAGVQIVSGPMMGALGLTFIVTDSTSLIETDGVTSGEDSYKTLLLGPGGIVVEESENIRMADEVITGYNNITREVQFEWAYNLSLKGFKWDVTNGGANPTDAALSTGTNWDTASLDLKSRAGVVIESS